MKDHRKRLVGAIWIALACVIPATPALLAQGLVLGTESSVSGQINADGDAYIDDDLEIGTTIYLNGSLFLKSAPSGEINDGDQFIYFFDQGIRNQEKIFWNDSTSNFEMSDHLTLNPSSVDPHLQSTGENFLELWSDGDELNFVVDSDGSSSDVNDNFQWYANQTTSGNLLMLLNGLNGDLAVDGSVTPNAFDLAEGFWMSEPVTPGELVAIDPSRAGAVRRANGVGDRLLLGVVSTRPAVLMGGGAFSIEDLRQNWGAEAVDLYESARLELEAALLAERPALRERAQSLTSPGAFASATAALEGSASAQPAGELTPADASRAYESALRKLETTLERETLARFLRRHVAAVALAGRVPTHVDDSAGAIAVGDALTAGPTPGVAVKATGAGPVIGTALEAHAGGSGTITVLVHRGWREGDSTRLAASPEAERELRRQSAALARKDAEIAELRERLGSLERAVEALQARPDGTVFAGLSGSGPSKPSSTP